MLAGGSVMFKTRILLVLAALGLIVGVRAELGARSGVPAHAQPALALASPRPTGSSDWDIAGEIQEVNGEFWTLQGFVIKLTDATRVDGDVPSIGTVAQARGIVLEDGTWLATEIHVGSATTPTPVLLATATAVPPTATDSPVPPTVIPPSPTPTAAQVPTAPVSVSDSDDGENQNVTADASDGQEGSPRAQPSPPKPGHGQRSRRGDR